MKRFVCGIGCIAFSSLVGCGVETLDPGAAPEEDSVGIAEQALDPAWAPNVWYSVNQRVTFNGYIYKCIQAHTSQIGWEPPIVPALWGWVGVATRSPVAIVVRSADYPSLQADIAQYKADVEARFPVTLLVKTGSWSTAASLRNSIKSYYNNNRITGAILIGELPDAIFHFVKEPGEEGDRFPLPFFYEDLDGSWQDRDGDGDYDWHEWGTHHGPEIWVSTIKGLNATNGLTLSQFFQKTHSYFTGAVPVEKRVLDAASAAFAGVIEIFRQHLFPTYGTLIEPLHGIDIPLSADEYLASLSSKPYEIVSVWTHAGIYQAFDGGEVDPSAVRNMPGKGGVLTTISGCHLGDWLLHRNDNVALSYFMGHNVGQAVVAHTRSLYLGEVERMYDQLNQGKYVGESYKIWQDQINNPEFIDPVWPGETNIFQWSESLFGNPFVKIK